VHGEDIRRPLGIPRTLPGALRRARDRPLYARGNAIIGGKTRVAGVTLQGHRHEFLRGRGPLVEGASRCCWPPLDESRPDELSGRGSPALRERP